jgi:hypothetical protein
VGDNLILSKHLVNPDVRGFKDVEPLLFASGEIGIYFINAEKYLMDGGQWKEFGNDSKKMMDYTVEVMNKNPIFKEVAHTIAESVRRLHTGEPGEKLAISGGQKKRLDFFRTGGLYIRTSSCFSL